MKNIFCVLVLSVVGMAFGEVAGVVEWEFPRTGNCHEGLPFSDGKTGVLVWGGGDTINLTLGRSDLWDHRGGYPWTDEQSYTNILAAVKTGDDARLRALFKNEPPANWGGGYNPYMLPLGRIVVKVPGRTLKSGTLDTKTGLGELVFTDGGQLRLAMSTKRGVFAVAFPPGARVEATSLPATETGVYESILKQRGFEKAVIDDTDTRGGFFWRLPADVPAWISWRKDGNALFVTTGRGERTPCAAARFAEVEADSRAHWGKFWERSARVSVPDPVIQRVFDYGMYRFGAMTDPNGVPAGLQGPWLEDDKLVPWNGDYHFNINVQECYAPAYRGGHFDHLMPLFKMVLGWRARLRDNAKKFCGIDDGYVLPHSVDDRGTCIGGFWMGTIDHGCTAWVAAMMFRYVKYSGDLAFLKNGAYDFMKGAMNVYRAMMVEDDGHLAIPLGFSPEWGGTWTRAAEAVGKNASFQLAAAHRLARDLIAAAKLLGEEPDPMWADVEKRLPPYTADETGIILFEGQRLTESHRHHSHMAALFPFDTLDLDDPETRKIVDLTFHTWVIEGTGRWTGWCVPWASVLNVHAGSPERAVGLLRDWDTFYCDEGHGSHHNAVRKGFTKYINGNDVMQMDGQCAAAAAVLELMAHETNGKVEFFKGCPASWKEVSFTNLHLSDGSVVSGRRLNGKIVIEKSAD